MVVVGHTMLDKKNVDLSKDGIRLHLLKIGKGLHAYKMGQVGSISQQINGSMKNQMLIN
ncbi:Uncharacterised protein [Streptococcus pneumoniae]|nr:Uncharacterised protein [Streptococcus pneumoniae]